MNITGIKTYRAMFYNDRGEYVGKCSFKKKESTFKYQGKTFNVMMKEGTEFTDEKVLFERRIYQYNINNPNPFLLNKKAEPVMSSEVYTMQLETKIIRDLNDLSKGGLAALLTPRNIIIAIILIGIVVYLSTGHTLTTGK